ncbi:S-adenosylmethionine decarboxylase proenzyme [Apostichopus japonicus]|uniref:S-adenosylmethionine decarboxylase proenzyme n=1 Tax=Stichopus japonicus TaxID=307972 RepID=A0A2G8L8R7_STIJA|nr:S-adenosylmethionine decarboxylase proenzyme [Apostichopus japonicus]
MLNGTVDIMSEDEQLSHYEGTEKLLEVWFRPIERGEKGDWGEASDLRSIPSEELKKLMTLVKCEIVSVLKDEHQTAYILRNFIVNAQSGFYNMYWVHQFSTDMFYSRKNFLRPELQHNPHKTFEKEVERLDKIFDCGAAYVLGRMNGECWYLYTLDRMNVVQQPDQTLEIS